jgi:hypothetical protein
MWIDTPERLRQITVRGMYPRLGEARLAPSTRRATLAPGHFFL